MEDIFALLADICGENSVFTDEEHLRDYEQDQTLNLRYAFDILVKPGSPEEIAGILRICNQYKIPVTPRGGGSGVTGGALPVMGGVVLSLEKLNKIISINKEELYVIAESGVVTDDLRKAVKECDLYFPVFPSSSSYSFVGGNVAENAGAINSCKFGSLSNYVLNLEVVLPTGEIIWTGANVTKSSAGLNITRVFVGSEGVLGVITKIVFRLLPAYLPEMIFLAAFDNLENACKAVLKIKASRLFPSAVELIRKNAISVTAAFLNEPLPLVTENVEAILLLGLQEYHPEILQSSMNDLFMLLSEYTDSEILVGETESEKARLTRLRLNVGNAMTSNKGYYRDIDACVPLTELYGYIKKVECLCFENGFSLACFGHAMDGNMHTMILLKEGDDTDRLHKLNGVVREIYTYALSLGGVISGEHGIGILQKEYMRIQYTTDQLDLMKRFKLLFDPNGILNPGKLF